MASSVIYPDLEAFLTTWYRKKLAERPEPYCEGFEVSNKYPPPGETFPDRLLVIRFDGQSRTSVATAEASVGLSVLAGTRATPKDANDAALMVLALAEQLPAIEAGNPVTRLVSANGPIPVEEAEDRANRYIPVVLAVVGTPF